MNAPRLRKKDPATEEKDEVAIVHNETKDTSTSHGKTHQKDRLSDSKKFYNYAALLSTVLFLVFICCKRFSVFKLQLHDFESGANYQVWPLQNDLDDKLLGCEERIAVRAARVEHMCKKLTQEGSNFKDILRNTEIKNSNVWIRHILFMEF